MTIPDQYTFPHYLESKKSVDDRALNLNVWNNLKEQISKFIEPINILEIGGGIGTMFSRILEWGLAENFNYTIIDNDNQNIIQAPDYIKKWAQQNNFTIKMIENNFYSVSNETSNIQLKLIHGNALIFADNPESKFDLLIGHAVLDLFDLKTALPKIFDLLNPEGLAYFTINYDGVTIFEPQMPQINETNIITAYNHTMDTRITAGTLSGDSKAGRHLFSYLNAIPNCQILSAGSSDWVVFPYEGKYKADEAYFLHHILHFFESSLSKAKEVNQDNLSDWLTIRHSQIVNGELIYIAHQYDILIEIGMEQIG